ncbi:MAG: glycosyltransferase family 4 protein [Pseudomonadota bacterium]
MLLFHCKQDTGYAIGKLEHVFHQAAISAGFSEQRICYGYTELSKPATKQLVKVDYYGRTASSELSAVVAASNIKTVLAFDLQYPAHIVGTLRRAGVTRIVSYWGASMSGLNTGLRLLAKRLEWFMRGHKPDLFVFESEGMRQTATHGRGIPQANTRVVHLGVDTSRYKPAPGTRYANEVLAIPKNRKIVFYSGHMEHRKGVHVIIEAAKILVDEQGRSDVHFLICGNQAGEADHLKALLEDHDARRFVTFGGYRDDIPQLMQNATLGTIASTGWDSFTMSSIEMMACGLPIIVSDLPGLRETVCHGETGYTFEAGDQRALARLIATVIDDPDLLQRLADAARNRAVDRFSQERQIEHLASLL